MMDIIEKLERDAPKGITFTMARSEGRTRLTATAASADLIDDSLVRSMTSAAGEANMVPTQIETDGSRVRMELHPGKAIWGNVARIARDDRTMLVRIETSTRVNHVPLCGVGVREHMLLTKPGDFVTVLLRDYDGRMQACGMINHTMADDL